MKAAGPSGKSREYIEGQRSSQKAKGPLLAHWWGFGPWDQNTHTEITDEIEKESGRSP